MTETLADIVGRARSAHAAGRKVGPSQGGEGRETRTLAEIVRDHAADVKAGRVLPEPLSEGAKSLLPPEVVERHEERARAVASARAAHSGRTPVGLVNALLSEEPAQGQKDADGWTYGEKDEPSDGPTGTGLDAWFTNADQPAPTPAAEAQAAAREARVVNAAREMLRATATGGPRGHAPGDPRNPLSRDAWVEANRKRREAEKAERERARRARDPRGND
jgi:hypothetical protein